MPFAGGDDIQFNGVISGSGGLKITSDLSGRHVILNNANTFSGGILLDGTGTTYPSLFINNAGGLGTGTLTDNITGSDTTRGHVQMNGSFTITNAMAIDAGAYLVIDTQNYSDTFSGQISGTGSLLELGTGTETLSGANTYSGGTNVNSTASGAGLTLANNTAAGTGTIVVASTTGGTGVTGTRVSVQGGITVSNSLSLPSSSSTRSALFNNSGANTWSGPITLTGDGSTADVVAFAGNASSTLTITGGISGAAYAGRCVRPRHG